MPVPPVDSSAPIIIVGAGRSGTTRLNECLAAHRDVYMVGETQFMLRRLWSAYIDGPANGIQRRTRHLAKQARPEWRDVPAAAFHDPALADVRERLHADAERYIDDEMTRLYRAFADFVATIVVRPELARQRWGFKEIWAGGDLHPHDWSLYDAVFPRAAYIQSVRHPLDYLRSVISHLGRPAPTADETVHELTQWVRIVSNGRTLAATGRYTEFRMEDLEHEWPRVRRALGLDEDPACAIAGRFTYIPSAPRTIHIDPAWLDRVPGLRSLAESLGYDLPTRVAAA